MDTNVDETIKNSTKIRAAGSAPPRRLLCPRRFAARAPARPSASRPARAWARRFACPRPACPSARSWGSVRARAPPANVARACDSWWGASTVPSVSRQAALSKPPPTKGVRRGNRARTLILVHVTCMACACAWHVHGSFDRRRRLNVLLLTVHLRVVAPRSVDKSAEGHAREQQASTDASHHPHGAVYHHGRRRRRRWRPGRPRRRRRRRRQAGLWHPPRWRRRRRRWRRPGWWRRRQVA